MQQHLSELFVRELGRLKAEVEAYENEADLWTTPGDVKNSPGNLALHLIGNLNHFVGHHLGNTGFVRDRESEFANKHVPREAIVRDIEATQAMIPAALAKVSDDQLKAPYPQKVLGNDWSTEFMLLHLLWHIGYHVGQVNYHRRML